MNAHKLIAIALAALLVFAGGAAALPGQASNADAADDNQPDDPGAEAGDTADGNESDDDSDAADAENETDVDDADANETDTADERTDDARDENAADGPPTDLPDQVPAHVTQIHDLIRSKLSGNLTGAELGSAISDIMGSNDAEPAADDESAEADAAPSEDARSNDERAGPPTTLPAQAADRVGAIHDAITSFLSGDSAGTPGDAVSSAGR